MAIIGPADLPAVLKVDSDPIKRYLLTKLGYPAVAVELTEDMLETIIRTVGDFIAGYFPRQQRLAVFYTSPLQPTYPLPRDAYWVEEVAWNAVTSQIFDIFGAEAYLFNTGNLASGSQGLLLDYHLLAAFRKFSSRILGSEGHWEVINEVDGDATKQLIRLYPTPKGVFPVIVLYIPVVNYFRSPQAKMIAYDMLLAEAKMCLGNIYRKVGNMPSPTGGNIGLAGDALVQEGAKEKEDLLQKAISLGEPLGVFIY